jgi:hypothetical protein
VGWHFLYEGISKLGIRLVSSLYLMQSKWLLAGSFIDHSPSVSLAITDFLNIWGLSDRSWFICWHAYPRSQYFRHSSAADILYSQSAFMGSELLQK